MNRHHTLLALSFLLTALVASPAAADDAGGGQVEVFLSSVFANSVTEGSFGLRGALQLGRRFHLEGSLSRLDDDRVELFLVDLSAKYYLRDKERTDVYLLAGPGLLYSSDLDADELMVHAGVGAEFSLGRRFYLRPELRGRWLVEDFDAVNIGDLSLGFGWRF